MTSAADAATSRASFGRRYWAVVAAEAVVTAAGIVVITNVLHAPQMTLAWITSVVGAHFLGLAAVWRRPALRWLAAAMTTCGAVGLVLGAYESPAATVGIVAGVVPGALLLGSAWWGVHVASARTEPGVGTDGRR